ncbi:hypothetical protein QBC40DRAFT_228378 [Triangularia verruculosa]|uniref:BTB domain-containing protein n=1 Tax=Triangularia verruculosa TaxID=2587418 RepID=A0AAN6XEN0_9PEZI|nr:hypothetical protein QBC40DRAFT_228378 [Triangularia verruculosa]
MSDDEISRLRRAEYQQEIIDPDGDLFLHVGPASRQEYSTDEIEFHVTRFQVCSATLRRASPFFKSMLFGPWVHSKPSDPDATWVVDLPEDDDGAMEVILNILHGRFNKVPRCDSTREDVPEGFTPYPFDTDLLYDIVVAVDKYDLFHVVQPFLAKWVAYVSSQQVMDPVAQRLLLETAWILGDEAVFASEIKELALNSFLKGDESELVISAKHRKNWDGFRYYSIDNVEVKDEDLSIEDLVRRARTGMLQHVLDWHHQHVSSRLKGPRTCSDKCDALILGTLMQRETKAMSSSTAKSLWTKADDIPSHYTVRTFLKFLGRQIYYKFPRLDEEKHEKCGPEKYWNDQKSVMLEDLDVFKKLIFTKDMIEDMKEQRKKWFGSNPPELV